MLSTIRTAVFIGFGLVAAIWVFAKAYFTGHMAELEQLRSTDINARYTRARDLLTTVRGHVLMGSVVRDALLDPNPAPPRNTAASSRRATGALMRP